MAAHQNGLQESARVLEDGTSRVADHENSEQDGTSSRSMFSIQFVQKILAEFLGTYFLIFAGCAVVVVNQRTGGAATLLGIAITWGFTVMVMIYSVGHVSGAHFNPAVTIAFATCGRFPWKQVPAYVAGQVIASIAASLTLVLLFGSAKEHFFGTVPKGSDTQSLVLEFITSFYLMFVISGVATDNRAIGEVSGLAIGGTVLLNILFAGKWRILLREHDKESLEETLAIVKTWFEAFSKTRKQREEEDFARSPFIDDLCYDDNSRAYG
ncbi:hypothetical protein ACP70R_034720 [Stipagrostis hirtigluma subsp. patula]